MRLAALGHDVDRPGVLIAHLSDPHLRPAGLLYQGLVDSNAMFAAAVRHLNGLHPRPDLVILSGDVVDDGTPAAYAVARDLLAAIAQPLLVIPGNHDERRAFRACFPDQPYAAASGPLHLVGLNDTPIRILGLDITVPGQHHGDMDRAAEAWLNDALASDPDKPTIIMMHQPPIECGVPYIDAYACRGGDRLVGIVARYPAVERILCGHVHRSMQLRFGGTLLCTAPSTTTAIALRPTPDAEPASFLEPPGMLLHRWAADTGLVTHLVPIGSFPGPFPFA